MVNRMIQGVRVGVVAMILAAGMVAWGDPLTGIVHAADGGGGG